MREFNASRLPSDVVYKDVVVIGNGPSGISLSFMLAGNRAYCKSDRAPHADELLEARLNCAPRDVPLAEQDLELLANGLEGRTTNPVSLLLDNLQYPSADLGMELPSMLDWRYDPDKMIDHVVLGKGNPGGSWHFMDPHILTLSLGNWMSLPGYDFNTWLEETSPLNEQQRQLHQSNSANYNGSRSKSVEIEDKNIILEDVTKTNRKLDNKSSNRAPVWQVAKYYEHYVKQQGLQRFFKNNTCVVGIKPVQSKGKYYCRRKSCGVANLWSVTGYDLLTFEPFHYLCKNVVLASGSSDLPNSLGIPGELNTENRNWLTHDVREFERQIEELDEENVKDMAPVLILGAGLSSADAVIAARARNIPVIHVFRHQFTGLDKQLPENMYPEYHKVHRMMKEPSVTYPNYTALPEHTIVSIEPITFSPKEFFRHKLKLLSNNTSAPTRPGHRVKILNIKTNTSKEMIVSFCAILIGSRPDLTYLPDNMSDEKTYIENRIESYFENQEIAPRINAKLRRCAFCRFCKVLRNQSSMVNHLPQTEVRPVRLSNTGDLVGIGVDQNKPVDCRLNPIAVNKFTNKVLNAPDGLYAMGPLVGDNFVRFIPGGALAIVSDLYKNRSVLDCDIGLIKESDTRS